LRYRDDQSRRFDAESLRLNLFGSFCWAASVLLHPMATRSLLQKDFIVGLSAFYEQSLGETLIAPWVWLSDSLSSIQLTSDNGLRVAIRCGDWP
jgi:hypothetical protein